MRLGGILVAVAAAAYLAWASPAFGDTVFAPTRYDDPVPNGCAVDDCSLREAILAAESTPGTDTVYLQPGTYKFEQAISTQDTPQTGDLDISTNVHVTGTGPTADNTVIDANFLDRAFDVFNGATLFLYGVTIEYGRAYYGYVGHAHGGGIHNHGNLTFVDGAITQSCAPAAGIQPPTPWGGGGLTNAGTGVAVLQNVTIVRNCATRGTDAGPDGYGGGIENGGSLKLFNVTIAENYAAPGNGSGISNAVGFFSGGTARLNNTIVAINGGGECAGPITSVGYNLASDGTCSLTATGDLPATDPLFESALMNPDGVVYAYTLLPNSPALDAGSGPYDATPDVGCPGPFDLNYPIDELGTTRPQDGNDDGLARCDIGAYERPDPPPVVNSVSPKSGATDVKAITNVSVAFNESMDQSATQAAFSLVRSDTGVAVAGTFSWNGNTMIFDPNSDLTRGRTYTARVSTLARDSAFVNMQSQKEWKFTIVRLTAFPASVVIGAGTLRDGDALRLRADDNAYYEVNSTMSTTPTAAWYGSFTGIPNGLGRLQVVYKGKNSLTCNQALALYNFTTAAWRTIDTRAVGTTEVSLKLDAPGTQADYVSGTSGGGEVRARVKCEGSSPFYTSGDLMKITFAAP